MKRLFTLLAIVVLQFTAGAQTFGHLTIFSEDGDAFTLILNGETINDRPQTNLRVEELTQPYYNARIVFADANKAALTKTIQITDVDNVYKDVTYKLRRDKNNASKMKLSYFSQTEVRPDFIPPSNVQVIHYGQPVQVVETTTTTVQNPGMQAGVNVNGMGVGISMTVNDPLMNGSVTQTTTTTTTTSSHTGGHHDDHIDEPRGCARGRCMTQGEFGSALESLKKQNFEDSKLKLAKQIAGGSCLSADQVKAVCKTFNFEDSKLDFAKFAYSRCTDPQSYFKVNEVFSFSSSTDDLADYIASGQ